MEMLWGLDQGLWASGQHLLLSPYHSHSPSDRKRVAAWIEDAAAQNLIQGLVVMSDRLLDAPILDYVLQRDIPVVTLEFKHPGSRAILLDNVLGGELAAAWLAARCQCFKLVLHDSDQALFKERQQGFQGVLGSLRPGIQAEVQRCPGVSFERGWQLGSRLQLRRDRLTGIFVTLGDIAALGLRQSLIRRGYRPGRHFLIVGYDGLPAWRQAGRPFPTIVQPLRAMGAQGASLMLEAVAGKDLGAPMILKPSLEEGPAPRP